MRSARSPNFSMKRAVFCETLEKYTSNGVSVAIAVLMAQARRDASSSILSGRKPDQWSSSVMTTGAWR